MFEVAFRVQHDCPYTRFTIKHPEVRITEWCNNRIHVMEIDVPDIETFTRIEPDLNELLLWKGGKILKKNFLAGNLQLIVKSCHCSKIRPNISDIVERTIRDTFVISLNSVFSRLTERQVNSLIAALEAGYYQIPKKVTTTQIAGRNKVPRTTFEEHLRKAESKVLQAIAPYVRLYTSGVKPPEQPLKIVAR